MCDVLDKYHINIDFVVSVYYFACLYIRLFIVFAFAVCITVFIA